MSDIIHNNYEDSEDEKLQRIGESSLVISSMSEQLKAYTDSMSYKINIIVSWELSPEDRVSLLNEVNQMKGSISRLWRQLETNTSNIFRH